LRDRVNAQLATHDQYPVRFLDLLGDPERSQDKIVARYERSATSGAASRANSTPTRLRNPLAEKNNLFLNQTNQAQPSETEHHQASRAPPTVDREETTGGRRRVHASSYANH